MEKAASEFLNPCIWSDQPGIVAVSGIAPLSVPVIVHKGVTISIRVADTQALLAANPATDDILIGAAHGGSPFIPARHVVRDATGKLLSLVVPAGVALNLSVRSSTPGYG